MNDTVKTVLIVIGLFVLMLGIAFGVNALIVWAVCKIMGWTFAWKWVILFTIIYGLLSGIFRTTVTVE